MYEGVDPYIFISYSHNDVSDILEITRFFQEKNIRYWYDNGLYSGDDWNLIIAEHLERASVCLFLLSSNSASSPYVKNELNFAINHRIPIHTLLLEKFILPIDIEMMIGRIQMVEKSTGYEQRLFEALPSELYDLSRSQILNTEQSLSHPLFTVGSEIFNRQGTITHLGYHKTLGYEILIQEDKVANANIEAIRDQIQLTGSISHPVFPKLYDIVIKDDSMITYQEYRREEFLDVFLANHKLEENQIVTWIDSIIEAMDYLYSLNLGFRDFARGSMVVCNNNNIGMFRLQNLYYGIIKLQHDNKQFYFEKEVQEIGVLLYQLCTREIPVLPFRIIESNDYSKRFLDKINLIIQKCSRENHRPQYNNFSEIKEDLKLKHIRLNHIRFLRERRSRLKQYEEIKAANLDKLFTGSEVLTRKGSLEEDFGFDSTVLIQATPHTGEAKIKLLICSTGQVLEFAKDKVVIGRSPDCDMILQQPSISRMHTVIFREAGEDYYVQDMDTTNGTFVTGTCDNTRLRSGQTTKIKKGDIITVGTVKIQLC